MSLLGGGARLVVSRSPGAKVGRRIAELLPWRLRFCDPDSRDGPGAIIVAMHVASLDGDDLEAVRALCEEAYPFDRVGVVLEEKLLGPNGSRPGTTLVAWDEGKPVGVIALAGRWVKL